jgi:hypothetical protein
MDSNPGAVGRAGPGRPQELREPMGHAKRFRRDVAGRPLRVVDYVVLDPSVVHLAGKVGGCLQVPLRVAASLARAHARVKQRKRAARAGGSR